MPYPSKKFRQNPFTSLRVIRRTDRQTDRTENITSFFGGGNEYDYKREIDQRASSNLTQQTSAVLGANLFEHY